MISFRNPSGAASFAAAVFSGCIAVLPLPAIAGGHGGMRGGPGHPPPPLILDSGAAGRSVSSDASSCYVTRKKVVDANGNPVYRRIQVCQLK